MPTMTIGLRSSLAVLLALGLSPALGLAVADTTATKSSAVKAPGAAPAKPEAVSTVTVRRCTDARGQVTLQDDSCPAGSREETREMTRPRDPPKQALPAAMPLYIATPEPPPPPPAPLIPPPPMYHCTSYDGIERFSESYDPNPRCEPIVLYYPYPNQLTPSQKLACRWVEDSCVRLSDRSACARWRKLQVEARSAVLHAFSDTAAYRKSELERLNQIVEESCP